MKEKPSSIFRKSALEHLSFPEQLDQLIRVVSYKSWLILAGLGILLFALILWLIFGSIPTYAEGTGILIPRGSSIETASIPDGPSHIEKLLVKPGDIVQKGQKLADLSRPDILDQIKVAQKYVKELTDQYQQLYKVSQEKIAQNHQSTLRQREALANDLINNKSKMKNSLMLFRIRLTGYKNGVDTNQAVVQAIEDYFTVKSTVQGYPNQIAQLDIAEAGFRDQWRDRLLQLRLKISDTNNNLKGLEARNRGALALYSPITGKIINVQGSHGSVLQTGDPLFIIASLGEGLDALIFLTPYFGKQIKAGMEALISPTSVVKAEFGSIYAKVITVESYPTTASAIVAKLQNPELAKALVQKEVPIMVRVRLQQDPSTKSGFKWSSSKGPNQIVTAGNLATGLITIRKQPPITLVIPTFKKLMGID